MKKITKTFIAILLCFCTVITFTACKPNLSKTTVDTTDVLSNGGISVYHDGWLYFINGSVDVDSADLKGVVVNGGIYRVMADENGAILYETTTDENGNETKSIKKLQPVINKLVGYKYGSLKIYGDYLYYTTPCTEKNKSGEMLTGKTEFRRYDLVNKVDQLIYTTKSSDDTLTYDYVKKGEELYLVIFEGNEGTLTSLSIGDKIVTAFYKTDVQSLVISENDETVADGYIYFTLSFDSNSALRRGVRVYKVLPDGSGEVKLSEGESVTILTVKGGRLLYSCDSYIFSIQITDGEDSLSFDSSAIVCTKNYENIIFLEENNKLSVLVYENEMLRRITWDNGAFTNQDLHEFDNGDELTFVGVDGDWVVYTISSKVYKSRYKNITTENQDDKMPILLSTTEVSEADELMAPEIVNGYVYAFSENSLTSKTYLYRISLEKPETATSAEFVGKAE